jgi:uncharacterized protein (DUF2342 family)
MKRLIIAALALGLAACTGTTGIPSIPPAPLEQTVADEKALTLAGKAVDTAAISASALVRVGVIEPNSPTAQRMARALDDARNWVNAAAAARAAGNARSYAEALAKADEALSAIGLAVNPGA